MTMQAQYFCYVYNAPEGTPLMYALEAGDLAEAVAETRRMMRDERTAFAEIWDGVSQGMVERVEQTEPMGLRKAGLLRALRRGRPSSGSSRP
jgi:hypothetical protein